MIPMYTMTVKIASLADVEHVAALFNQYRLFYAQKDDLDLATEFIRQRIDNSESVILLAEDIAGKAVGFCQLYPTFCSVEAKPIYSLYDLFVLPECRKHGIGRALLLQAEVIAKRNGKSRMDLTTAKTNTKAQSVYESLGWVKDDVFYAYSKIIA